MKLQHARGDLIKMAEDGLFDIIVHGCNCFCTMGSGIARQIREQYPFAYEADKDTDTGDINKLGNYTFSYSDHDKITGNKFLIINAYTQFDFNRNGNNNDVFEYASFGLILKKLAYNYPTSRFGFPYIGMGLAGGDRDTIIDMLEGFAEVLSRTGGSVTLVEYGG